MPITNIAHVHLDDLVGYEIAEEKLIDNTVGISYRDGQANNCSARCGVLVHGKSSRHQGYPESVLRIRGLRIIEGRTKHQFKDLNDIIADG
ncbi:MAG: hypothetical protein ACLSHW_09105 [Lachnospiraceae bacterium]